MFKRYDTTINTNSSQAVIWAVGPVNNKVRNLCKDSMHRENLNFSRRFSVNKSFDKHISILVNAQFGIKILADNHFCSGNFGRWAILEKAILQKQILQVANFAEGN